MQSIHSDNQARLDDHAPEIVCMLPSPTELLLQITIPGIMGASGSKLECKSPVPSDIEIAQSIEPLPIGQIARKMGLKPSEVFAHGPSKAKASSSKLLIRTSPALQDSNFLQNKHNPDG